MIYYKTSHPILIKKIYLKIWRLRDEIERVVEKELPKSSKAELISKLRSEYLKKESDVNESEPEEISDSNDGLDSGEDEMVKALAAAENGEEEISEDSSLDNVIEFDANKIIQRRPKLKNNQYFKGITILTEITMDSIYIFTNEAFSIGESVVVDFLVPNNFSLNAEIDQCRPYNFHGRIISENKYPYRMKLNFTFLKNGEKTLLRNFIKSIEAEIPEEGEINLPPKAKGKDDFDDLDELDL